MNFNAAFDFWLDYITFGVWLFAFKVADKVDDVAGEFASFLVYLAMLPVVFVGTFVGLMLTALLVVVLALSAPVMLPVSIYLHRRKRQ